MRWLNTVVILVAAGVASAQAQSGSFVLSAGKDTVSVERFRRTPSSLEAEMLIRAAGARLKYQAAITAEGLVTSLTNRFWQATDSASAPARQLATIRLTGDSVIADMTGGGRTATQRLGTTVGALPYINPSFALLELVIARARKVGGSPATIPVFMVSGGQTLPVTVTTVGADSVVLSMAGGEMRVRIDASGQILGGAIPAQRLVISRAAEGAVGLAVEKPDYSAPAGAPYQAIDVTVPTPMGHALAGTLTLPRGASQDRRVPAVVTITGSGLEDRDEAIPVFKGYRPFREFADSLGRRGIAVLRMDDRGYGGSGGNATTATSEDFAQDIRAGLAYLRTRPEINGGKLAAMGHSEGGMIAPMVAKQEPALAGIVLLAGTAYTGRQILNFQLGNGVKNDTSLHGAKKDSALAAVKTQVDSMVKGNPWLKFFADYEPIQTARQVRTPVLILNGARDQQVTPDQVPLLEQAFKAAGNRDVTARVLPDLNHLFVHDPDGFPGRYTELKSFAVDRATIGIVVDWLVRRLAPPVL